MTQREQAFAAMRAGSLSPDMSGTSIYGVECDTMNEVELRIALGWAISQSARLLGRDKVGRG